MSLHEFRGRRLLLWQDVRIHLDTVAGLGSFVELEAVAPPDSDLTTEHERVAHLREHLRIEGGAYYHAFSNNDTVQIERSIKEP